MSKYPLLSHINGPYLALFTSASISKHRAFVFHFDLIINILHLLFSNHFLQ
jgi:hypothetical protein